MLGYIANVFTGFGIVHYRSTGHFDYLVLSVLAETAVLGTRFSVPGHDVAVVAQMQQCPVVAVAAKNYVAASSSVTSVGASIRNVFFTPHVRGASAAFTGTAIDFYVVNKIRFSHILVFFLGFFIVTIGITGAKLVISGDMLKFGL